MALKLVHSTDGRIYTHRPTEYNTDPAQDRTVYFDGESLCRVIRDGRGLWCFHGEWAGLEGSVVALSFDQALANIKHLHRRCVL